MYAWIKNPRDRGLNQMITSQDIEKMNVADLRKEAQRRGITSIQSDERGVVAPRIARKNELIQALKPYCEVEVKVLEIGMFKLNDQEQNEVNKALEITGMSLLELAKAGLLMKARRIASDYTKVATLDPQQRKNTTLAGAANANLRATADSIVQWNHGQYNNDLRVYLNASILRNLTGSNLNTIKDFLSLYRTPDDYLHTAEEHNLHYGLTDKDNRKGRDEFGNKIKISELIKQPAPSEKPQVEVKEVPTPELPNVDVELSTQASFAQRIDKLESDSQIKAECESLMEALIKENGSKGFSSFKKLVTPYRTEIQELRLRSHNTYTHEYKTPHTLKDGEQAPKGAQLNDEGKVVSEPRHSALKFLSPELYKDRFAK
jgi:hypothetical protein